MLTGGAPVVVVNNNGTDKPHYWDGGAGLFLVLTNSVQQRASVGYLGRLFGGNVYDGSWLLNRIQWSDDGDITAWSGATSGSLDLKDEGDPIYRLGILPNHIGVAYRWESVYLLVPTGDPYDPIGHQFLEARGMLAANSLQSIGHAHIFLGHDDIYLCTVSGLQPVGLKVREDLFKDADPAKLSLAWSFLDKREKDYYLVIEMSDSTQRAFIYNYEQGTWTQQDLTGYTCLATWRED